MALYFNLLNDHVKRKHSKYKTRPLDHYKKILEPDIPYS